MIFSTITCIIDTQKLFCVMDRKKNLPFYSLTRQKRVFKYQIYQILVSLIQRNYFASWIGKKPDLFTHKP